MSPGIALNKGRQNARVVYPVEDTLVSQLRQREIGQCGCQQLELADVVLLDAELVKDRLDELCAPAVAPEAV